MRISGFCFLRNADSLGYPFRESIASALPLVDEFVVALAKGEPGDATREALEEVGGDKLRLVPTTWDLERYPGGIVYAQQTDLAKEACAGDWLLYLQGDEVLHEADLPGIREGCEARLDDARVDGFVFDYLHFWGSYDRYLRSHAWYAREIRIIRNDPDIHSLNDAQSFRRNPDFDGMDYRSKKGTSKLACVASGARVFHYGHVRPPRTMAAKSRAFSAHHREHADGDPVAEDAAFEYGSMRFARTFRGTHPAVMARRLAAFDWGDELREVVPTAGRALHRHEQFRNRLLTWVEDHLNGGRALFQSEHFRLLADR